MTSSSEHDSPYASSRPSSSRETHSSSSNGKPSRSRRRRGRGKGGNGAAPSGHKAHLTSQPTTRNAYVGTREWLLEQHGPVCAYCGTRYAAADMTLDHVAPRKGQTAYDRRDNLVLACKNCNALKKDLAPMAFLLRSRQRALNLLRYGSHLSQGLLELARTLVPEGFDPDSPYRD